VIAILPWFFNESSNDCRSRLLTSNFARNENIIIRNKKTRDTRLYCRWCAIEWCNEHVNKECRDWQAMKTWRRHNFEPQQ